MNGETGGPAFPQPDMMDDGQLVSQGETGMTLRDYFAAKAMGAWLLGSINTASDAKVQLAGIDSPETIAGFAYHMADAMLKARES
jgi:hypothetical protein